MKIIIFPSFKHQYRELKNPEGTYLLYGRCFDNYTVFHLTGLNQTQDSYLIGHLRFGSKDPEEPLKTTKEINYPYLDVSVGIEDLDDLQFQFFDETGSVQPNIEFEVEFVDLDRLFVRIDKTETPLKVLIRKKVLIIGMGSGGSLLALYLAKSGVKDFVFIDNDRLETHNIIRHICDLTDLGRYKTLAVKDYITKRIPDISIRTIERKFEINTKADFDYFTELFQDIDLIAAVSGEHDVNFALNDFIFRNQLNIPIIYAGTFDGVKAGLMFKVDPLDSESYCYHCIYSSPDQKSIPTPHELEQNISYDRTLTEQLSQPGLGLDVDNLTILLAKFCLDSLLKETDHGLYHFTHRFYMWYNRTVLNKDQSIRFEGLELYYYEDLEKDSQCPFHGSNEDESIRSP
ncbi:MAG: HesA/MoeB/ThiF family protein [Candidatus Hodarchaeales archaeon]